MKKLTLHRETLRLVSSQTTTRDKVKKGTAVASPGSIFSVNLECYPEPMTAGC